jgi:hypothetical protein
MIKSHPQLLGFPDEANFLWHPSSYPFSNATLKTPHILQDPEAFTALSLAGWPPEHPERIKRTFGGYHCLRGIGKTLCIKSAMVSFMIPDLVRIYPDARFIHIFRHGVPVAASFTEKERKKYPGLAENTRDFQIMVARYWRSCIEEIDRANAELGLEERGAFMDLRYEALCKSPSREIERLSAFLKCDPGLWGFDLSSITDANAKVGDPRSPEWHHLIEVIENTLSVKGY